MFQRVLYFSNLHFREIFFESVLKLTYIPAELVASSATLAGRSRRYLDSTRWNVFWGIAAALPETDNSEASTKTYDGSFCALAFVMRDTKIRFRKNFCNIVHCSFSIEGKITSILINYTLKGPVDLKDQDVVKVWQDKIQPRFQLEVSDPDRADSQGP